jgi:peptide/nickel transport system permease protein
VQVAAAIALEATLSFLGLGLPITEPSLGLADRQRGYQYLLSGKYWISFFPASRCYCTIVSINLGRRSAARRAQFRRLQR